MYFSARLERTFVLLIYFSIIINVERHLRMDMKTAIGQSHGDLVLQNCKEFLPLSLVLKVGSRLSEVEIFLCRSVKVHEH